MQPAWDWQALSCFGQMTLLLQFDLNVVPAFSSCSVFMIFYRNIFSSYTFQLSYPCYFVLTSIVIQTIAFHTVISTFVQFVK